jgi:hypothetical protein
VRRGSWEQVEFREEEGSRPVFRAIVVIKHISIFKRLICGGMGIEGKIKFTGQGETDKKLLQSSRQELMVA